MELSLGLALFGSAVILLFVARPREGAVVSFLQPRNADVMYAVVTTALIGLGLATVFDGIVGLSG